MYFDSWHASYVSRQLENRSGELIRSTGRKPISWGECQDLNASRMKVLLRPSHIERNPEWECNARKNRLQIDKRGRKQKPQWYDQEYRMTFRINQRAFAPIPQAPSSLWESRACYESQECNLRSKLFKNASRKRISGTWQHAQSRNTLSIERPRLLIEDFQGREHSLWSLAYRHAKLKFSHAPPIEDNWHRSVKSKLDRLISAENSAAKYQIKKPQRFYVKR